jgi:aryl-alcohol dehydrogenase-like predicted oxidoreductase
MFFRNMGRTGLKVSELCLGAMTFGRESSENESFLVLDHFLEVGGNFIDTADVYSQGASETLLGKWMRSKRREDLVIATKVRGRMGDSVNDEGLSRKHILASIDNSLHRLETDYIDLYQIHSWHTETPFEETLHTLNMLVNSGKVRYIGASNVLGWQLQKMVDHSKNQGWEPFSCLQPLYNLLDRGIEWELLPVCLHEGIGVIPWSPLRGGWLSGKYQRGMTQPPAGSRIDEASRKNWGESWEKYNNESTWVVIDTLLEISKAVQKTPAQVALNWLLRQLGVTAPIIGARNLDQLQDNLGATGWALEPEHLERLDLISKPKNTYPYSS